MQKERHQPKPPLAFGLVGMESLRLEGKVLDETRVRCYPVAEAIGLALDRCRLDPQPNDVLRFPVLVAKISAQLASEYAHAVPIVPGGASSHGAHVSVEYAEVLWPLRTIDLVQCHQGTGLVRLAGFVLILNADPCRFKQADGFP